MNTRYWYYKCNKEGGPAGASGVWLSDVFSSSATIEWGCSYSTRAAHSLEFFDNQVRKNDVVVAYQTDTQTVVGYCLVKEIKGPIGDRKVWLQPIYRLKSPFRIHEHKIGTPLDGSGAVMSRFTLTEFSPIEMKALVKLTAAPSDVLEGKQPKGGYQP